MDELGVWQLENPNPKSGAYRLPSLPTLSASLLLDWAKDPLSPAKAFPLWLTRGPTAEGPASNLDHSVVLKTLPRRHNHLILQGMHLPIPSSLSAGHSVYQPQKNRRLSQSQGSAT